MGDFTGPQPSTRTRAVLSRIPPSVTSNTPTGRRTLGPVTSRPALVVAVVAAGWGTIGAVVRQVDLPAVAIVAGRVWIAALALGLVLRWKGDRLPGARFATVGPKRTLAQGVILAAHWVALVAALQRAPVGTVLLVTYLAPVGVAALAPVTLGERVPRRTAAALALGLLGVALVASPSIGSPDASGVALAAVAGGLMVFLVLISKSLAGAYGGVRLAFNQLAVAGVVLVPVAALADWGPPRASWLWLVALGLVHTALAMLLYLGAMAHLPASEVGVLMELEPASGVLVGWLLLDESPTMATLAGGALIVAAGVLVGTARRAAPVPTTHPEVAGAAG